MEPLRRSFDEDGFAIVRNVASVDECEALGSAPGVVPDGIGSRDLLRHARCAGLASRLQRHPQIATLMSSGHVPVQCTWFEKSPSRNWLVPLYQDLAVPVAERVDAPVLRNWTVKAGTAFVQPPVDVLEQLVAVRLHLDPCMLDDGPLRVVPGSHRNGRLAPADAQALRDDRGEVPCTAGVGDAVVLRPLLLHASSKATGTSRRRVLHFVFGPPALPHGLRWDGAAEARRVFGDSQRLRADVT